MDVRWAFLCDHPHTWRERLADGRMVLVCHTCGRRVPLIARTEDERATMRARYPDLPALAARKGPPS
jgi:hypothetical protein